LRNSATATTTATAAAAATAATTAAATAAATATATSTSTSTPIHPTKTTTLLFRGGLVVFRTAKTPYIARSRRLSVFRTTILTHFVGSD
jgi:hypothetical protein